PNGKLGPVAGFFQEAENRQLLDLLGDMVSQEVFLSGGKDFPGVLELLQKVQNAARFGPFLALLQGGFGAPNLDNLQVRMMVRAFADHPDLVKVPDLILGFRITDTKRAQAQLKRLEELLGQVAVLKDRLKRGQVAGGEFLTLTLDGRMVPWDEVPFKDL